MNVYKVIYTKVPVQKNPPPNPPARGIGTEASLSIVAETAVDAGDFVQAKESSETVEVTVSGVHEIARGVIIA